MGFTSFNPTYDSTSVTTITTVTTTVSTITTVTTVTTATPSTEYKDSAHHLTDPKLSLKLIAKGVASEW
ncbi:hypothetical protein [Nostoc sp. CHAB 5715]|uniref:hypothetical protein n=1 Tax=Nostoc sp. CHAB 5715 TaxID=2780400 RepID=UPI001E4887AE|nr:hypothetical protein [Nostoc sp. CHAB 5715]MCC5624557.1 hypothetical protein [Nostoc sp. CHAB 5715]